jgi:ABC-type dipeptide/oligopeptide/nickel transport system permease subunit
MTRRELVHRKPIHRSRFKELREFFDVYRKNRLGLLGLIILIIYVIIATFAPFITPYDPYSKAGNPFIPPNPANIFGTDELGRDIFSLVIYGTRISLFVGILATVLTAVIGSLVGVVSGYIGGLIDDLLMRITDLFLIIPGIPFLIVLSVVLGSNIWNIILVIAIISWPSTARLVRSETLTLKTKAFIESAKLAGAGDTYILFKHILINVLPLISASVILTITRAIILEAGLSFLGLGDPTKISWGTMLYFADRYGAMFSSNPYYIIIPGVALSLLGLSFVFISYAIDELVNPRLRTRRLR